MRTSIIFKSALILACFPLAFGCQKETGFSTSKQDAAVATKANKDPNSKLVKRAYHDSFTIILNFAPDLAGGWTPADVDAPAWYPGTGPGNATHMGNATTYFNNHTLRVSGTVWVYHAPVGMFYAKELAPFGVKPTDSVTLVNDDGRGNSIWFTFAPGGVRSFHPDATHVGMTGTMYIVNGTGKFAGATGETTFNAQFDQTSFDRKTMTFSDASLWQDGWIRY